MNRKWTTWRSLKSVLLVIWSSVVLIGCASVEQAAPVVAAPDKTQTKEMISNQLDQAQLLLASEQYNEAYTLFRGILVTEPENFVAMLGIAEIQLTVGNYDRARIGFELVSASTEHRAMASRAASTLLPVPLDFQKARALSTIASSSYLRRPPLPLGSTGGNCLNSSSSRDMRTA